jgi:hypothetical protein
MNIGDEIVIKTKFKGVADSTGNCVYVESGFYDANKKPLEVVINKSIITQLCTCPSDGGILFNCPTHGICSGR